ncbi:SipW-dependent-type signal peptide-containing protein [Halobellus sp. H-GB7]|uniref:SipW-dependent-type signal peptide-containing protein n=1 Tax=Halobellus sp. H-GB7 TaxID=3069756 RepID=UPI0027B767FE|nr:SipW-dependent-type signal peptide-containing protein [Halobellus sp. H-GB7]MDQ2053892.1 SipW-dependent-type signal peptide-containing protein [Halobellus sp. H-GB7]
MTDEKFDLSRRKVLGALGAIGAASAGAGLGTSAYFNDTESFENNTLTAGELDLKVDWEEHYSFPQAYGFADPTSGLNVTRSEPADTSGYVPLPDPENPMVWVAEGDLDDYMDATSIEAYPDRDGDRIQEAFASESGTTTEEDVGYICEDGADMDEDLDPKAEGALRTNNADTWDAEKEEPKPLVSLDDVKPGDFGELTLSYHLCGNPGYVWLRGALRSNAEGGVTEPEGESAAEDGTVENPGSDGELLDAIQTRLWYDDGDNVAEVGDGGDDAGYLTPTLSLGELLLFLESGNGVQLCPDDTGGPVVEPPAGDCPDEKDYDSVHVTEDTVTVDTPLTDGSTETTIGFNPKCADFGLIQGLKTDEAPEGPLPESGEKEYDTPYGTITVTTALVDGDQTVTDWSISSDEGYCVAKVIVKGGNEGANVYSYDNAGDDDDFTEDDGAIGAESDLDTQLQTPTGQDISHVDFCLAASTGDGNGEEPNGEDCCFEPSTDHYIGLAWWLPTDVGNEIQSDSVGFDLGLYTEQCRHNDQSNAE